MKKIYLLIIVLLAGLCSCDQDNIGALMEADAPYVAFASSVVPDNILSAENNFSVTCVIVRSDLSGAETTGISLEMNEDIEGVFDLESTTVTFESGSYETRIKIVPLVAPAEIDPTKSYVFNLSLTGDNISELYSSATYKASFEFTPIGSALFQSPFFGDEWPVEVSTLEVGNILLYKLKGLYEAGYDITLKSQGNKITVDGQAAWFYDSDYGDVFVEGSGTIDGKTFSLTLVHYIPDVHAWDPTEETLILP